MSAYIPVPEVMDMRMTKQDQAYGISSNQGIFSCSHVPELSGSQEEAGTKMFLCAQFAVSFGLQSVEIIKFDSDIAILSLYFQQLQNFHKSDLERRWNFLISNQIICVTI